MRPVFLEGRALHIFPCGPSKRPTCPHGFKDAVADAPSIARLLSLYPGPLIGVATGVISGIDVIDIDPRHGGDKWFFENRDRLPKTRTHETQNFGQHLIYRHLPGQRCSNSRIAPGVDLKGDGGFVIWWPAHGSRVLCEGPVSDFPAWLANGGMGVTSKADCNDPAVTPILPLEPPTEYQINYAKRALGNACFELGNCAEGSRNTKLNALAYKMGRLIVRGWLPRERVESYLLKACEACGVLADDGLAQCRATIASGINAGMTRPYHDIGRAA